MNEELLMQLLTAPLMNSRQPLMPTAAASGAPAPAPAPTAVAPLSGPFAQMLQDALAAQPPRPQLTTPSPGRGQHVLATRWTPEPEPAQQPTSGGGALNAFGGGGGGMGSSSPWDALFSVLGQGHGAIQGNDPNTPMVPGNRNKHSGDDTLTGVGGGLGTAIGGFFGFPGAGRMAGQNVGATVNDLFNGDIHNLGLDVSQNLPPIPGMRDEGWKGLVNGATGLPLGWLLDKIF